MYSEWVFFPKTELTRDVLIKNMKDLTCIEKNVKPHSLRIGGHTYYTVYGLDPSFRDYLARRKVKESTQTYYRASPHLTIYKLRQFFKRTFKWYERVAVPCGGSSFCFLLTYKLH